MKNSVLSKTYADSQKSNKKLYLIFGGIGAVVLIGAFSIVAAAFGLMYLSRPKTTFEGIPNSNSARTANGINANKNTADKPQNLKEHITNNQNKFDEFKLIQVETNDYKKWFPSAKDEALASFSSDPNDSNEIIFSLSNFNNAADAKKDADGYRKNIIAGKMKIVSEKRLTSGLILHYANAKAFGIMDCRDRLCISITGVKKDKVEKFYQSVLTAHKR